MPGHKSDYLEFGVKVGLDSKEAQRELQELQKQLNSLGTLSNPKIGDKLSADMQKASQAAAQLKIALDSAIDVDTGRLDLSKFSRSLKDSGMKLKDYRDQLMSMGSEGEKAFTQVANSILKAEAPLRRTSKLIDTMWTTLKNTARWELSSSILHGLESSLQKAVTYAQDLNKSLTDIRIVTGYSTDHMAEFAVEANKAAKALSATTTEYTNASLIYFQQGLSDQQVKERTEVTVKMANVTRDSAQTVSDQMTAVWNNFADGSHTLEYYADVMTALGAATASSTKEISDGLEKFAAVAETVGLSYEYAASALATITSNTRQSADVVGTALKTLFARIQGLSLGETLEDGTDLNKYSEALAKVGIQVKEQNGELKAMDDILNEMADVWDTLNNDQQVALAQTVAGVRQYTQLVALMENWDNGDEDSMMANLRTSANATGALQEQADVYAESWEAARDRVTAALESIFNKLLKDEFFIDTLNSIEKIITGIDKFIDSIGGLQGVLTGLGAVATKVFNKQLSSGLSNFTYNLNFGAAKERDKQMRIDAANAESSILVDTHPGQSEAYKKIGQLQVMMIERADQMSDIEKELANHTIERYKNLAKQTEELAKQVPILKAIAEQADNEVESGKREVSSEWAKEHGAEYAIRKDYDKDIADIDKYIEDLAPDNKKEREIAIANREELKKERDLKIETSHAREKDQQELISRKDNLKEAINQRDIAKVDASKAERENKILEKQREELKALGKDYSEIDKKIKENQKSIEGWNENQEKLNEAVKKAGDEYKKVAGEVQGAKDIATFENASITEKMNDEAPDILKEVGDEAEEQILRAKGNIESFSDGIVGAVEGISSLVFGLQSLGTIWETVQNPDMSGWEKFVSILTTLSFAISSIIGGISSLITAMNILKKSHISSLPSLMAYILGIKIKAGATKEDTKQEVLNTIAKKLNIAVTKEEILTTSLLTKKILAKVAAWILAHWWILALVAAYIALAAAVKRYNEVQSEEAQMNLAKQALEETTATAEKAKTAYEELKSTVESYKESVDAIDKLKEGTEEYNKAIENANEKAKQLIETYKLYDDWEYDKNGLIKINQNVLDEKVNKEKIKAEEAENAKYGSEIFYANRTLDYAKSEVIDKYFTTYSTEKMKDMTTASAINYASELSNISTKNKYEKQFGEIFENLADKVKDIDDFDVLTGEQILETLKKSMPDGEQIATSWQNILENEELTNALIDFTTKTTEAANASKYFAEQIIRNKIEEEYGDELREKATVDGAFDQSLYNSMLDTIVGAEEDTVNQIETELSEAKIGDVTTNDKLNKVLKEDYGSEEQINNDEDLALTYARIVKGIENTDSLSYIGGWNKGSLQDIEGNYIIKDMSDDAMRKAIAQEIARQSIIDKNLEEGTGANAEDIKTAVTNIVAGANAYDTSLSTAILNNISNDTKVFDLSSAFRSLTPDQVKELKGASSPEELLNLLGFTEQDIKDAGYSNAKDFYKAFTSGLKEYSEEDYILGLMEKGKANAEEAGFDPEVYENYIQAMKNSGKYTEFAEKKIHELALANMKCERGLVTLTKNWKDWQNKLKNGNMTEVAEATNDLQNAFMDITGLPKEVMKKFDADFFKKYSKEISDIVKGTEGSIQKMKKIIGKESLKIQLEVNTEIDSKTVLKELEPLHDIIAGFNAESIEIGAKIDDTQFLAACQEMIDTLIATGYTAEQAQGIVEEYLSSMGFDVEVKREKVPIKGQIPGAKNYSLDEDRNVMLDGNQPGLVEGFTQVIAVKSITKNASWGGNVEINDSTADESGGGSESSTEPLEYEDEIERYHENTRALERLSRALEKVSTAKDRAFGKERLRLIDEEITATERLVGQQRALLAETKEYLKQDFAEIQQYGFTYDEYGELTNYDEVMKAQIDKYNAVVAMGDEAQTEQAKKEYDEFKKNMEQYEETLTQYEEAQAQLQEYINQVVDLKLEKITTEVEIKVLINDKELTRLEYLLRKIEYGGKDAADAIGLMGKQFDQINEKAKPIQEAIDKIYEQARAEGRGLLEEEVKEIKSFYEDGTISSEEEKRIQEIYDKAASEDRMLTQAEEEQIQEYKEQLLELNEEVMDIVETIEGKFIETLEDLNGKVEESIGRFATYTGMFQTLSDVITLSGKANSKYGMDILNTLSARTVANASAAMRSNLQSYEALDKIYKEEQLNLERAIQTGDERLIKQYTERLHDVEMMRETSYESMLSSWSEALQAANDLFDTKLTNMITSLKQNLGDIDKLVEIYDRAVELEDLYISGNKSIYELSKLARDIGKDIDKTANIIAKNKLTGLLEQINKLRAEGVKLSQYDLEYWQAKYELELAEIALQEAQEAKAQVKLTRNTAGGWGYTYTADAEAISEAQQNYEDSMYAMQEVHDEYIRDYSERLIKNRQELVNAFQDLDKTSLTYEEDLLKLKEHYFAQEEYLIAELEKAYERAGVSYQDTILGQTYGDASLQESHANFINSITSMIQNELLPGYEDFQNEVDNINEQAGTTVEQAMDKIVDASVKIEDEVTSRIDDMTTSVKEVSDEIWSFQETYSDAIANMLISNEEYYSKTIKMYKNFMEEIEADKWLQYFNDMASSGEVLGLEDSNTIGQNNNSAEQNNNSVEQNNNSTEQNNSIAGAAGFPTTSSSDTGDRGNEMWISKKSGAYSTSSGVWELDYGKPMTEEKAKEMGYETKWVDSMLDGMNKDREDEGIDLITPEHPDYEKVAGLSTGGYTGAWGSEGKWAILHEKELVLNKQDTENVLNAIDALREIDQRIKFDELWPEIEKKFTIPTFNQTEELLQEVKIEANFPGISDKNELEEAFHNLINTASQYANRHLY